MPWIQVYDPLGNPWLSTAAAALPIVLLLVTLGVLEWRAHIAALAGLVSALAVSVVVYGMPVVDRRRRRPSTARRTGCCRSAGSSSTRSSSTT